MPYLKRIIILIVLFISCNGKESTNLTLEGSPKTVEILGKGSLSTSLFERDMAISSEGDEIIFTLGNYTQNKRCLISMRKNNGNWGQKEILPFSGKHNDIEPFFSENGKKLFFASNRPMTSDSTRTDYNIWMVDRLNSGWGKPIALDTLINSEKDEFYPSLSKSGNLYFTTIRPNGIGSEDIFMSKFTNGSYERPICLDTTINSTGFEFNSYISPEEDLLVFSSFGREDGFGGGDLYSSKKDLNGNWTKAKNMGARVNSDKLDYCPFIDFERGNFYFTSNREIVSKKRLNSVDELETDANKVLNGMGNIYRIGLNELNLN